MKTDIMPRDLADMVLRFFEDLSCPRSLTVAILLRNGDADAIAALRCVPEDYCTAQDYLAASAATDLLRKCSDLPTSYDRRLAAVENFWKAEHECYRTNERLTRYLYTDLVLEGRIGEFLLDMKRFLKDVLGPAPSALEGRFGPGSTFGDRGKFTTLPDKMSSCPTLTQEAFQFIPIWGQTAWARALNCAPAHGLLSRELLEVGGNRFLTVPKDCEKDRGICVEPSINLFYQLGVGRLIRKRLKQRCGVDLKYGQQLHRRLACEGSLNNSIATIDLSNASDTVCKVLVKL